MQSTASNLIQDWLKRQPEWLHQCAAKLCQGKAVDSDLLDGLMGILEDSVRGQYTVRPEQVNLTYFDAENSTAAFRLVSIQNVRGINRLSSESPLKFRNSGLIVVYGGNGSGKSGFVRLLKAAAGKLGTEKLLPNIFQTPTELAGWEIVYESNGVETTSAFSPDSGSHEVLSEVQVFDERLAKNIRILEQELSFEPPILNLLQSLILCADELRNRFAGLEAACSSRMPVLPNEFSATQAGKLLGRLSQVKNSEEIESAVSWDQDLEDELERHQENLRSLGSQEQVKKLRGGVSALKEVFKDGHSLARRLNSDTREKLSESKRELASAQKALEAASASAVSSALVPGVGSQEWKLLWDAAKQFSLQRAYPKGVFPVTEDEALCVLCQQPVGSEAKYRFQQFEAFVESELSMKVTRCQAEVTKILNDIPTETEIKAWFNAVRLHMQMEGEEHPSTALQNQLVELAANLRGAAPEVSKVPGEVPSIDAGITLWLTQLKRKLATDEESISTLTSPEVETQRSKIQTQIKELLCKKWLFQQREAIEAEWQRLRRIKLLQKCKEQCSTADITQFKVHLFKSMVTDSVRERFIEELRLLGGTSLSVELHKSKGEKGKVLHKLSITGVKRQVSNDAVLSEGEQRVISLAAFLADAEESKRSSPLVFDDPVTSLDHVYESKVAHRLVVLSRSRQVLVFTHRLAFARELELESERERSDCELLYIKKQGGETGRVLEEWPLKDNSAAKRLKSIKDVTVKSLRVAEANGDAFSEDEARRKLMSVARESIEQLIEYHLLSGIVTRFSKEVRISKVLELTKIKPSDCALLDRLIEKYCFELHEQPAEKPYEAPSADDVERDIDSLIAWVRDFKTRPKVSFTSVAAQLQS